MKRRYELTISTNYVPDWGIVESFRELFQNALDNQTVNTNNKMEFCFNKDTNTIEISNRESILEIQSLLLGSSTKRDDENTIGKHGEGYKIAFMVLLREGKTIKVYNYGNREIWEVKLVKSRRYNGELVPVVIVEKEAIWKSVPNNNLIIGVGNISEDEYNSVKDKNLHLQDNVKCIADTKYGRILDKEYERGNIYVNGLFVSNTDKLRYGYDFHPSVIKLDRDRKLVDSFDMQWQASKLWGNASENSDEVNELLADLVFDCVPDVDYIRYNKGRNIAFNDMLATKFKEEHGNNAYPVSSTDELRKIEKASKSCNVTPVVVSENICGFVKNSDILVDIPEEYYEEESIKEKLEKFKGWIIDRVTDEELDYLNEIIEQVGD